ncbi:capsular biosynthesis protein [Helicobacter sp. 13S00477-4]|uniref:capsular biosynthesis protein n=1 Tax=Helicobacter sp. 13S00477-4 TaxID=1905759 RepID=UPI000BA62FAE|nr:capsular biosynthesis protein [Helicobacter sp. 13S00477-4]
MKRKIAILCDFDIAKRPRPFRMIKMLQEEYKIFAISKEGSFIQGIECFSFPAAKSSKQRTQKEDQIIQSYCYNREFDKLIYTPNRRVITDILTSIPVLDLIIVEDITLLPFASDYVLRHPNTKILIDLREYYPLEYENDFLWLETFGVFFKYLCTQYLPCVDFAITVSEGIAMRYQKDFGIACEIFYSLPPFFDLVPSKLSCRFEIIYHGFLSPDRHSKNLLQIAHLLDERFCLNIMGLSNQKGFIEGMQQEAQNISNLKFLAPVCMEDIIPFCNRFDIGLITLPKNGFNNTYALPNKFFEYIQSRLCVVSTPIFEVKSLIEEFNIGQCANGFEAEDVARVLNGLDKRLLGAYKHNASNIAQKYSTQTNHSKIISIIEGILNAKK